MSATTKFGRSRNRRESGINAQSNQLPPLLGLNAEGTNDHAFRFNARTLESSAPVLLASEVGAVVNVLYNGEVIAGTVVNVSDETVIVDLATPVGVSDEIAFLPWNNAVRGFQGEWVAPFVFNWNWP